MVERLDTTPGLHVDLAPTTIEEAAPAIGVGRLRALVGAVRPKQWAKNALVLAAPAAAGIATQPAVLARSGIAFVAFCLVASATYLINDVADRDEDRLHPVKRYRPIASGLVPTSMAVTVAVALVLGGLVLGLLTSISLMAILAIYLGLTTAYSLGLRRVAVVELGVVASGFVIRVIAGGLVTGIPISQWLLIVVSFGALFVVAGKRYGDLATLDHEPARVRVTLRSYTLDYLRFITALAAAVMLIAYCLWAFTVGVRYGALAELSVLPLTLAVLRYGLLLENGRGGAPEDVLLGDRALLALILTWAVVYGLGIYLGG